MLGLLLLSAITTFQPPRPTVGDPITIEFAAPTEVAPSPDYEVVSRSGNRVVIRTFVPHTIAVTGRAADGPVSVMIPIHSVLKPDDKLEPAPLKPPKSEPWPRLPFIAIGVAALAAIAVWSAVIVMARRRKPKPIVIVVPKEEFRVRVRALRRGAPMLWAQLADAVRAYLAAVRADFGAELTTKELLARVADGNSAPAALLARILRQGDLEKFSPWGAAPAAPADFEDALNRALEIPEWVEPEPVAASEQEVAA
ncbi:MAG: hypothetical protein QOC81_1210 [Thermoanaerobaculia bacterium]|jgi:hypothetical protein|nr:hypothetical protein [Thermoanaerobaculia bacterium]